MTPFAAAGRDLDSEKFSRIGRGLTSRAALQPRSHSLTDGPNERLDSKPRSPWHLEDITRRGTNRRKRPLLGPMALSGELRARPYYGSRSPGLRSDTRIGPVASHSRTHVFTGTFSRIEASLKSSVHRHEKPVVDTSVIIVASAKKIL